MGWIRALTSVMVVSLGVKWAFGLRNGTRVPRGGFATAKIFAGGSYGAAKSFRSGGPFS